MKTYAKLTAEIVKLRAQLALKVAQRKESIAGGSEPKSIWCLEGLGVEGDWFLWTALADNSYDEALEYLREHCGGFGQYWKLPNGDLDLSKWRVIRYRAVRATKQATFRFEQKDLKAAA